jgi:glycosyltransferase involved in cell wall biosynthesis
MPVNVLFIHSAGDWLRGSENVLLTIFHGMDRTAIRPYLLTSNASLADAARQEGVEAEVQALPDIAVEGRDVRVPLRTWGKAVWKVSRMIREKKIGAIYCNGGSSCQVGHYAAKFTRVPVIAHLHAPYNRRYLLLYRLNQASRVIFVSEAIQRYARAKAPFHGVCEVVRNGVDTGRFQPAKVRDQRWRQRLLIPGDSLVFGQVSSLISRKGIDVLLRAFQLLTRKYPEAHLVIVGDGPERSEFVALSEQLGLNSRVRWVGNQADPVPFYQHVLDINLLASRSEAFGLSLLEASSCGLPNIGSDVDGIPECVLNGQTGLLFRRDDHVMLAEKMALLAANRTVREDLAAAGREMVLRDFSIQRFCRSIERIVLEQISGIPLKIAGIDNAN